MKQKMDRSIFCWFGIVTALFLKCKYWLIILCKNLIGWSSLNIRSMKWSHIKTNEEVVRWRFWKKIFSLGNLTITQIYKKFHGACILPSLSKHITRDQVWNNRFYLLRGRDLWETAMESWNTILLKVLAQYFLMHH